MKTKRVTIAVNSDIDIIRDKLLQDTGMKMSYIQVFNYLIHYYKKHSSLPVTVWKKD